MSSGLSALLPRFGNPYAPAWMGFSPQYPGFRDEESDIDLAPLTVAASSITSAMPLAFDSDADYMVRELWSIVLPTSQSPINPQDLRIRIRDGNGRLITSDFVYANDLNGPLAPVLAVRRGSVFLIEFQNANATENIDVHFVIRGCKRYPCENVASPVLQKYRPMRYAFPPAPAGKVYKDFEYTFQFDTSFGDLLKIPLQTDNDADFLWRGLTGQWGTVNATEPSTGTVAVTLYGTNGLALVQLNLPTPWGTQMGQVRENLFPNGGGRIAPQYPEFFIPRGGILQVDVTFGVPSAVVYFSLRGVKVYDDGACQ